MIPTGANRQPEYIAFEARLRRELHQLSAALKRSVPFHSPRYIGHMVSDLLLPGLTAQMLALPYNPNNVSADAAPVTIDLELKAGLQLAAMLGYPADPTSADCAFGHLTSGGTLANLQGLRFALALKAFPVALRAAGAPVPGVPDDDWTAFNLLPAESTRLFVAWTQWLETLPASERLQWLRRVEAHRIESLGLAGFLAWHPELSVPRVFAPATAHYSWSKGMKVLGLGRDQLHLIPGKAMRLDMQHRCGRDQTARTAGHDRPGLTGVAKIWAEVLAVMAVVVHSRGGAAAVHRDRARLLHVSGQGCRLQAHPGVLPRDVGSVSGVVGMIGGLGAFILSIAFGALNDLIGVWTGCFMLLFVLVATALTWMHFAIRRWIGCVTRNCVRTPICRKSWLPPVQRSRRDHATQTAPCRPSASALPISKPG